MGLLEIDIGVSISLVFCLGSVYLHLKMNTATETAKTLSETFDTLRTGDIVTVVCSTCMGVSQNAGIQLRVARRSFSKKYGVATVAFDRVDGRGGAGARFKLLKRSSGRVSLSMGDMATVLHSLRIER